MLNKRWLFTLCLLGATSEQATSFVMTTDALVSLSMSATKGTSSSFKDDKIVLEAKTDAASFVASQGEIRGAQLELAFQLGATPWRTYSARTSNSPVRS